MNSTNTTNLPELHLVLLSVCIPVTLVSTFLGYVAALPYGLTFTWQRTLLPEIAVTTGLIFGAVGGLLAGYIWCRVLMTRISQGQTENLIRTGVRTGIAVGLLATVILHSTLIIATQRADPIVIAIGLTVALIVGSIFGLIFSSWLRRKAHPDETAPNPDSEPDTSCP